MAADVAPMIHVADVRRTTEWYARIGFAVEETHTDGEIMTWALLSFGAGRVMFNAGGRPSTAERREVDLYVQVDDVQHLYHRIRSTVPIVCDLNDAFYGMREFTVRDPNGFWITFGQPLTGA